MKEAKKTKITEQLCKQIELMRKGGANQTEVGRLLGINGCTVSRIEAAGYDFAKYTENRKIRRKKEAAAKKQETEDTPAEEQPIDGQIEMDLTIIKPEMSDQTKMMRFQAAQIDKLIMKLDQIYNMTSMILRSVRKE